MYNPQTKFDSKSASRFFVAVIAVLALFASGLSLFFNKNNNTQLYAETTYTISYDLDGGMVETANPTSYTDVDASFTLNNPIKTGYVFLGWTGSNLSEMTKTVTIETGTTGDLSFVANWTQAVCSLEFGGQTEYYQTLADGISALSSISGTTETNRAILSILSAISQDITVGDSTHHTTLNVAPDAVVSSKITVPSTGVVNIAGTSQQINNAGVVNVSAGSVSSYTGDGGVLNVSGGSIASVNITNSGKLNIVGGSIDSTSVSGENSVVSIADGARFNGTLTLGQNASILVKSYDGSTLTSHSSSNPITLLAQDRSNYVIGATPIVTFETLAMAESEESKFVMSDSSIRMNRESDSCQIFLGELLTLPTFKNGTGIYTYTAQTMNVADLLDGYDSTKMQLDGDVSKKDARETAYSFTITAKDDYIFEGGVTTKDFEWQINPATITLSVGSTSVNANLGDDPKIVSVNVAGWFETANIVLNVASNATGVVSVPSSTSNKTIANSIVGVGTAEITVSFSGNSNYQCSPITYTVNVAYRKILIPTFENSNASFPYKAQEYNVIADQNELLMGYKSIRDYVTIESGTTSEINVGDYTFKLTITDPNTKFTDNSTSKTYTWHITKISITLSVSQSSISAQYGDTTKDNTVTASGWLESGSIPLSVASSDSGVVTVPNAITIPAGETRQTITNTIVGFGTATVTVTFDGNANYNSASKQYSVVVSKKSIAIPTAKTGLVYNGTTQTGVDSGIGYTLTNATGIDAGNYSAVATLDSNHQWSDSTTANKTINWSIATKSHTILWTGSTFTYNGLAQGPSTSTTIAGENGETLHIAISGKQIDAGTGYTATATIDSVDGGQAKASNYTLASASKQFSIDPKTVSVVWDSYSNPEYDGNPKPIPTASAPSGVDAETINLLITATKSGESGSLAEVTQDGDYVATATIQSVTGGQAKTANYILSNNTKSFKVIKRNALVAVDAQVIVGEPINLQNLVSGYDGTLSFDISSVSGTGVTKDWSSPTLTITGLPASDDTPKSFVITVTEGAIGQFEERSANFTLTASKKTLSLAWQNSISDIMYGESQPLLATATINGETPTIVYLSSNSQIIQIDQSTGVATAKGVADNIKITAKVASTSTIIGKTIERFVNAVKNAKVEPSLKSDANIVYDGTAKYLVNYLDNFDPQIMEVSTNPQVTNATASITSQIKFKDDVADFYKWQNTSDATITIVWSIGKAQIKKPNITAGQNFVYNGAEQQIAIDNLEASLVGTIVSVEGNKATDANTYSAVINIVDTSNYEWEDGTSATISSDWTIEQCTIDLDAFSKIWNDENSGTGLYQRSVLGVANQNLIAVYKPFENALGTYTYAKKSESDLASGEFTVILQSGTGNQANYKLGTVGDFTISNSPIEIPTAINYTFVYDGNAHSIEFDRDLSLEPSIIITGNSAVNVKYNPTTKQVESYVVTLSLKPNCVWNNEQKDSTPQTYELVITQQKITQLPTATQTQFQYDAGTSEYQIQLQYDDTILQIDASSVTTTDHAGHYQVTFNVANTNYCFDNLNGVSTDKMAYTLSWQVDPILLTKPTKLGTHRYNGTEQSVTLRNFDESLMTKSGELSAIDAGEYTANVSLKDKVNYAWLDQTTDDLSIKWKIEKESVDLPIAGNTTYVYSGEEITYNPIISAVDLNKFVISGNKATNAGQYRAVVTLKSNNYTWSGYNNSEWTTDWTIEKLTVEKPKLVGSYTFNKLVQTATLDDNFDANTMTVSGNKKSDAGTTSITVELRDPDNYQWTTQDSQPVSIEWTIEKAILAMPELEIFEFIYDGTQKTVQLKDSTGFEMSIDGKSGTVAGQYHVTVGIEAENIANYSIAGSNQTSVVLDWVIKKCQIAIPTLNISAPFAYDGNEHTPEILGFDSEKMIISGQTSGVNAGIYKIKIELLDSDNYAWSDGTITAKTLSWTIDKSNNLLIIVISISITVAISCAVLTVVFISKKKKKKKLKLQNQDLQKND